MKNNAENHQKKEENVPNTEIEQLKVQLDQYTNNLKRLQADFENYIKRAEKDKQEFTKYASHRLISKLLNTLDDFERTLNIVDVVNDKAIKEGIEMVYKQLQKILTEEGVKPIEAAEKCLRIIMKTKVRLTRRNNKMCSLEAITGKVEYAPALRHDHNYTRNYIPILISP